MSISKVRMANPTKAIMRIFLMRVVLIFLGIVLFFAILETGLRLGGFIISGIQKRHNLYSIRKNGQFRILCLGESTTAGGWDSYPAQLEEILNKSGLGLKFSVINEGIPCTNTSFILSHLEENLNKYRPDMVITMMGINDHGDHLPYETISRSRLINILKVSRTYRLMRLIALHIKSKISSHSLEDSIQPQTSGKENVIKAGYVLPKIDGLIQNINNNRTLSISEYLILANHYEFFMQYDKAMDICKKALEVSPDNSEVWSKWIRAAGFFSNNDAEIEKLCFKAITSNPTSDKCYFAMGDIYQSWDKTDKAIAAYLKALELNPGNYEVYFELGESYLKLKGDVVKAETMFKKALEINPNSEQAFRGLVALYSMTDSRGGQNYLLGLSQFRRPYYVDMTRYNYRKTWQILKNRKIPSIFVQYPMRSVESLKKMFDSPEGIIFVDNEKAFKTAVSQKGYSHYFIDMIGGDFGHCKLAGNRLLAANIARVVIQEFFEDHDARRK
jgi:tetratricopeptide (TPR) repeat protein